MSVYIPDDSVDWILMNPPYSIANNGTHGAFAISGLTKAESKACQKEYRDAVKNEPAINLKAGMAASFLVLARNKVKQEGRVGFVMPLTAAFADSWWVTRRMIEHEFTDIIAITTAAGKALGKNALSADTMMGEMILVATRRRDSGERAPIRCITLYEPVTRPGEAGETARAIFNAVGKAGGAGASQPIIVGETEIGQVCVFDAGGEGAPWGPLGVTHADLAFATDALIHGRIEFLGKSMELNADMATLGDVFDVGPAHPQIGHPPGTKRQSKGAFEIYKVTDPADAVGEDRLLWEAICAEQNSLVVAPTHKGKPVADEEKCKKMRNQMSRLFYASGIQWNSQALLAAMTKHETMGGRAWIALVQKQNDIRICKAFALWANSTLGMMAHWSQGQRTQVARSTMGSNAMRRVPCPRLDKIDDSLLDFAAAEFDRLVSLQLRPTHQAHLDEARWELDCAAVKMLGLPEDAIEVIEVLRLLWCREPTIRGKKAFISLEEWDAEQS